VEGSGRFIEHERNEYPTTELQDVAHFCSWGIGSLQKSIPLELIGQGFILNPTNLTITLTQIS
jgi:hypothetical protein